ncbi:DUF1905 domain-containing protein [Micromonosporaceae bacterium Da 78-11]
MVIVFDSELWIWDARRLDTWTFVSLPGDTSDEIRDRAGGLQRGFGSLRVRATLGASTWQTSIFPDKTRGAYVLPVRRKVREAESVEVGATTTVAVELLDL